MNHTLAAFTLLTASLSLPVGALAGGGDYAVVVSKQTNADPAWHKVVEAR